MMTSRVEPNRKLSKNKKRYINKLNDYIMLFMYELSPIQKSVHSIKMRKISRKTASTIWSKTARNVH